MCNVDCPYIEKCTSHGYKCSSCANNKGRKDHYKPDPNPYVPYVPYYPPIWWIGDPPNYQHYVTCGNETKDFYAKNE